MKINIPLSWRYQFRTGPLFYSENDPTLYGMLPLYDMLIRKISSNKYGAKNPLLHHHYCSECGIGFWSSREKEGFCKRKSCFIKYHGGENAESAKAGI